ncbi:MAG: phosphomannomutase [Methylococcaceae bacterium]
MTIQELIKSSGTNFGTSGVRGLETLLTDELCSAYTEAFLAIFENGAFKRVALGMDLRPSSPRIAKACAEAILQCGFEIDFCGTLPTPALAFYAQEEKIPAIMVTGSHIPFDRNGIKFYRPDGEITKADEFAIINSQISVTSTNSTTLPETNPKAITTYVERYTNFFPKLTGLKLGLYEHSSVARDVFKDILEQLGAKVVSLGRTDVFVPIDTEAVSPEDVERGLTWSKEHGFDAIISTDGDGDRPLISDENGVWLRGDIVGLLCADYLNVTQLVVPVSCNTAIEKSQKFKTVLRTKIGSPFVIEGMQALNSENGAIAGFEANGGFLLQSEIPNLKPLPTRDAVLPALTILAAACEKNCTISHLLNTLPKRFTASDRLQNFPNEQSRNLIDSIIKNPALINSFFPKNAFQIVNQDLTDGLRLTLSNGDCVHLRPSGNAPELRCYAEAETQLCANELVKTCLSAIKSQVI